MPKQSVQTQFELPVDEEAAHYSEIAMENVLQKPREPIAEKAESIMYVQNIHDQDPGIRLGQLEDVSV